MKYSIKAALLAALITVVGCTIEGGELAEEYKNKVIVCTDTRDGEVFRYNTNTIRNLRRGVGAPHSFEMTTLDGRDMTLNSDMEAWLKCEKVEGQG